MTSQKRHSLQSHGRRYPPLISCGERVPEKPGSRPKQELLHRNLYGEASRVPKDRSDHEAREQDRRPQDRLATKRAYLLRLTRDP